MRTTPPSPEVEAYAGLEELLGIDGRLVHELQNLVQLLAPLGQLVGVLRTQKLSSTGSSAPSSADR